MQREVGREELGVWGCVGVRVCVWGCVGVCGGEQMGRGGGGGGRYQ